MIDTIDFSNWALQNEDNVFVDTNLMDILNTYPNVYLIELDNIQNEYKFIDILNFDSYGLLNENRELQKIVDIETLTNDYVIRFDM